MATKQSIRSDPAFRAAIARAEAALAAWRQQRRSRREPIPPALWRRLVSLARCYGLSPVAQGLKVNYLGLRRHLEATLPVAKGGPWAVSQTPRAAGFVEVPIQGWLGASWMIELEDGSGCKLTVRTAQADSAAALAVAQGLWSQRA